MPTVSDVPLPSSEWPYPLTLQRLAPALAIGLFAGLERQRRGKEAGLRTFALVALVGCLGGMLGEAFDLTGLVLVGALAVMLNVPTVRAGQGAELTTSAALVVIGFTGVRCGRGHTLTPAAVGVLTAALLSWKQPLAGFSLGLTEAELRSAVLLGILTFVIYPALPEGAVDPWGLIRPRAACGGLVSSASAVASAGSLTGHGEVPAGVAGTGAVLASLTSALVNLPLVARVGREQPLTRRFAQALALIVVAGVARAAAGPWLVRAIEGPGAIGN